LMFVAGLLALPLRGQKNPSQAVYPAASQAMKDGTTVLLEDYASLPLSSAITGTYPPEIDFKEPLGRANTLHSEPEGTRGSASRFFVTDLNAVIYILDKRTKKFSPYLNFAEIFPRFSTEPGVEGGVGFMAFDPAYATNGRFYTVHTEIAGKDGAPEPAPRKDHTPGLDLKGYAVTGAANPPSGAAEWQSVVVEWTDTKTGNSTFEGTAREVLRIGFGNRQHQIGDLIFNPTAKPGSSDYRNLYIAVGDGLAGETPGPTHTLPQQLDALQGKVLRITPDVSLRPKDLLSSNGRYRIPSTGNDPNPFVTVDGARGEIYAYGFRNPQRLAWDAQSATAIVNDIGLHSWEEINLLAKGANYGYPEREGNEQLFVSNGGLTGSQLNPPVPFPVEDFLNVNRLKQPVAPAYAAAIYSHVEGDAIAGGFVYRGKLMPQMQGKYIFGDITTGKLFYSDFKQMLASGRERGRQAEVHEIQVMYQSPYEDPSKGPSERRLYDIVSDAFAHKGGTPPPGSVLPGGSLKVGGWRGKLHFSSKADTYGVKYGGGRADVHMAMGADGEIYLLSKSDGMIRKLVSVVKTSGGTASAP
jgi:hypothetical protein